MLGKVLLRKHVTVKMSLCICLTVSDSLLQYSYSSIFLVLCYHHNASMLLVTFNFNNLMLFAVV